MQEEPASYKETSQETKSSHGNPIHNCSKQTTPILSRFRMRSPSLFAGSIALELQYLKNGHLVVGESGGRRLSKSQEQSGVEYGA